MDFIFSKEVIQPERFRGVLQSANRIIITVSNDFRDLIIIDETKSSLKRKIVNSVGLGLSETMQQLMKWSEIK